MPVIPGQVIESKHLCALMRRINDLEEYSRAGAYGHLLVMCIIDEASTYYVNLASWNADKNALNGAVESYTTEFRAGGLDVPDINSMGIVPSFSFSYPTNTIKYPEASLSRFPTEAQYAAAFEAIRNQLSDNFQPTDIVFFVDNSGSMSAVNVEPALSNFITNYVNVNYPGVPVEKTSEGNERWLSWIYNKIITAGEGLPGFSGTDTMFYKYGSQGTAVALGKDGGTTLPDDQGLSLGIPPGSLQIGERAEITAHQMLIDMRTALENLIKRQHLVLPGTETLYTFGDSGAYNVYSVATSGKLAGYGYDPATRWVRSVKDLIGSPMLAVDVAEIEMVIEELERSEIFMGLM